MPSSGLFGGVIRTRQITLNISRAPIDWEARGKTISYSKGPKIFTLLVQTII